MEESDQLQSTPPELREIALSIGDKLLPQKSKEAYRKEYKTFLNWCSQKNVEIVTENVMIAYFEIMGQSKKSSTVWRSYSILRTMLNIEQNTDISKFNKLIILLKRLSQGYVPKKSRILQFSDIQRFINESLDEKYLAIKVSLLNKHNSRFYNNILGCFHNGLLRCLST